jgi:hypothetical protein
VAFKISNLKQQSKKKMILQRLRTYILTVESSQGITTKLPLLSKQALLAEDPPVSIVQRSATIRISNTFTTPSASVVKMQSPWLVINVGGKYTYFVYHQLTFLLKDT